MPVPCNALCGQWCACVFAGCARARARVCLCVCVCMCVSVCVCLCLCVCVCFGQCVRAPGSAQIPQADPDRKQGAGPPSRRIPRAGSTHARSRIPRAGGSRDRAGPTRRRIPLGDECPFVRGFAFGYAYAFVYMTHLSPLVNCYFEPYISPTCRCLFAEYIHRCLVMPFTIQSHVRIIVWPMWLS